MDKDCLPGCVCNAPNASEAVDRAAKFIGVAQDDARSLVALLNLHGWRLKTQPPANPTTSTAS